MADIKFRVHAHSENATKTVVKARGFEMIIDEPANLGGTDEGANPVEYVLAAYSGCINVMAHIVAKELGFELRGMEIKLAGTLNPARLFGQSFEERAGYKSIELTMIPDCDADDATLEKWKEAVCDRCPVSDNLKNITPIEVKLKQYKKSLS
ncbi:MULTISPECIES: OsmC family protein [unclassified Saccharicrinis]|uniref:OsmC family protein n=1 Tax=unclassified Saccharicrinis TaxID=2646859 RepID=UPI003D32B02B